MASEASQLVLADTSQSVGDMQKAPEVLTAVPEVDTASQEASTTVGRPEPKISCDLNCLQLNRAPCGRQIVPRFFRVIKY